MRLWIEPPALKELKQLPGASRAKVRRAINALVKNPRPSKSIPLTPPLELAGNLPDIERVQLFSPPEEVCLPLRVSSGLADIW